MRFGQAAAREQLEETMRRSFEQVYKNSTYPSVVGGTLPVGMNLKAKDKGTTLGGNSSSSPNNSSENVPPTVKDNTQGLSGSVGSNQPNRQTPL